MQFDKLFPAPATGTADAFLQLLGVVLLGIGILMALAVSFLERRSASRAEAGS
jgi:hypothetical protein